MKVRESLKKKTKKELEQSCEYFIRNYEAAIKLIIKMKQRYEYGTQDKNEFPIISRK